MGWEVNGKWAWGAVIVVVGFVSADGQDSRVEGQWELALRVPLNE